MRARAVLFDLDGTLLDTLQDLAEAMNAVLERGGHPPHPRDDYRHLVGEGIGRLAERALPPRARSPAAIEAAVRAMREEYARRWRVHTRPYPGVDALLDGCFARGLRVAILSNKPEDFTRLTVEALLPRWPFAAVRGDREGVPRKPDPAGALAIARSLGVPPRACVFCGDTRVDMETGRAAGMVPVGVLWGFRDRDELEASGAARVVARPGELLALLDDGLDDDTRAPPASH